MKKRKIIGLLAAFTMALSPVSQAIPFMDTPVFAASAKLAAPKTFKTTSVLDKSVTLKWSKVGGASAYRVYRYDSAKKKYVSYKRVTGTSCKITGLSGNTTYKFRVCALVKNGKKYVEQTKTKALSVTTMLDAPENIQVTVTDTSVTLTWKKVKGAYEYRIMQYDPRATEYFKAGQTLINEFTIYHLNDDTEYKFKIVPLKAAPARYIDGVESAEITAKTEKTPEEPDPYEGFDAISHELYSALSPTKYGSAAHALEDTAIVTIFVDDAKSSWDIKGRDLETYDRTWQNVRTTCNWIVGWAYEYMKRTTWYFDFKEYSDLCYTASIDVDLTNQAELYESVCQVINKNIDSLAIKTKYKVNNIAYIVMVNNHKDKVTSTAFAFDEPTKTYKYPYEFEVIYNDQNYPAVMAQFMLHIFGAPYLNKPGEYGITQEFVDNADFILMDDIMYTYLDRAMDAYSNYDINNEFSPLTAYYIGYADYAYDVEKWGLEKSQHVS